MTEPQKADPALRAVAPDCFDDPRDFEPYLEQRYATEAACHDCTREYQAEMMIARRCHPPAWVVTPWGGRVQLHGSTAPLKGGHVEP